MKQDQSTKPMVHIGVTLDGLFDFTHERSIIQSNGRKGFKAHMRAHAHESLKPGSAFPFIAKMLSLNEAGKAPLVKVTFLTCCNELTARRATLSLYNYGLLRHGASAAECGLETNFGKRCDLAKYLYNGTIDFYFTTNTSEALQLLHLGKTAGVIPAGAAAEIKAFKNPNLIKIAADFDRVLAVSCGHPDGPDHAIEQEDFTRGFGLQSAIAREGRCTEIPSFEGPLVPFFRKLLALRERIKLDSSKPDIHLQIVTARSQVARCRIHASLDEWNLPLDMVFPDSDGIKGAVVAKEQADVFFDDGRHNVLDVLNHSPHTLGVHMPWTVAHLRRHLPQAHYKNPSQAAMYQLKKKNGTAPFVG